MGRDGHRRRPPAPPPTRAHGTDAAALLAFDRDHVWHPYSSALTPPAPYLVESAHGIRLRLRDRDGEPREVVDAMSSWWCAIHGYAVPELDAAARDQLDSDEPRDVRRPDPRAGGRAGAAGWSSSRPTGLEHVFLADSGLGVGRGRDEDGAAVRTRRGRPARTRFFTIRGGYHGDTFSPMSVTDPVGGMHALFARGAARARLRAAAARRPRPRTRRPRAGRLGARDAGAVRRARRRGRRRHRRAGAAGRRRHARLQPARAQRAARAGAPSTGRWSIHDEIATGFTAPARSSAPAARAWRRPRTSCASARP